MPPDVARRSFPWFVLLLTLLVLPLAEGAKNEKRAERKAGQAPAAPAKPVAAVGQRNQVWHTWTDVSGRTVEAIFCGLSGEFITLQPGDVLMVGTDCLADGTRPRARAGDTVEISAPGLHAARVAVKGQA